METRREANARRQRELRARTAAHVIANPALKICYIREQPHAGEQFRRCDRCRAHSRKTRKELIGQGLCCSCKQQSDGGVYCSACVSRRIRAALNRREFQVLAPYRAVVLVDQSTLHLTTNLRRVGFQAYPLSLCGSSKQRQAMLAHRVIITRSPDRLRLAAFEAHAAIVNVSNLEDEEIAVGVQKHWAKLRMVGKVHLMLTLERQGGFIESLLPSRPAALRTLDTRDLPPRTESMAADRLTLNATAPDRLRLDKKECYSRV